MKRLVALHRRELIEHRGALLWLPVGTAVAFIALALVAAALNPVVLSGTPAGSAGFDGTALPQFLQVIIRPTLALFFLTTAFYLLGAIFDERRDRSVLFWKSLPVSDRETVLGKLGTALLVTPLITFCCALLLQSTAVLLMTFFCPCADQEASQLWQQANLWSGALQLLVALLTQSLWWAPLWAWLLLVSATVPKLPVLWAIATPLLLALLERGLVGSNAVWKTLERRLDTPAFPSLEAAAAGSGDPAASLSNTLALWGTGAFWMGILASLLLAALTIQARRRFNEL